MDGMQQDWQPIKRKNTFHGPGMVQPASASTATRFDVLQINDDQPTWNQIEVEHGKSPQTDFGLSLDGEQEVERNAVKSVPKATKRHLRTRKYMGMSGIKTTGFSKDATTSGGFSLMDQSSLNFWVVL